MRPPRLGQQAQAILAAMLGGQAVTPMDAMRLYGSWRLAARIRELKQSGWNVRRKLVTENGRVHALYWIPLNEQRIVDAQLSMFGEDESHD